MKLMKPTSNWSQWSQNSPRNHWSQQSQEVKKSRSQEDKKPRRQEAKKPRSQETKKPRSQEAKKPRRQEAKKTRRQKDKKTKRQESQQPSEASEKHIKNKKNKKTEKSKKTCNKIIPNTSQPFAGLFLSWARVPEILARGHFTWKVVGSLFMSRPDKICKTHECIIPLRKACRQQKGVEENWSTIWTAIRTQWGCGTQHWRHNMLSPSLSGQYSTPSSASFFQNSYRSPSDAPPAVPRPRR